MGNRGGLQLLVMELVVWGTSGGGAAFQGLRGRSLWRGLGWEVKGDFLFCETFGMRYVPLYEGSFSEQAKNSVCVCVCPPLRLSWVDRADGFLEGQSWKGPR